MGALTGGVGPGGLAAGPENAPADETWTEPWGPGGAGWSYFTKSGEAKLAAQQIQEGLADYNEFVRHTWEEKVEQKAEGVRKGLQTRTEGIAALKELGQQAAYETKTAYMGAELTTSSQEARLGASGVRASGSPLLAAQQMADVAWGAAAEKGRAGAAGMTLGGMKLAGSLADIRSQTTLLTNEYQRQIETAKRKRHTLVKNANEMVYSAQEGAIVDWTGRLIGLGLGLL